MCKSKDTISQIYHFLEGGWDSYLTTPFSQEGALQFSEVETGTLLASATLGKTMRDKSHSLLMKCPHVCLMFSGRDGLYKYAVKLGLCSKEMLSVLIHWDEGLKMWLSN